MVLFRLIIVNFFAAMLMFMPTVYIFAADKPIEIETYPDSYVFNLTNMKPGDWATRDMTITNSGREDFVYNTKVVFKGGSKKLYDEFLLTVWAAEGELFDGKLHEFNGFSPRVLASGYEEDLRFQVKFPWELGNEYQGLGFEVEFKFTAEERTIPPPDPPKDPRDEPGVPPSTPGDPRDEPDDPPSTPEDPRDEPDDPSITPEDPPDTPDDPPSTPGDPSDAPDDPPDLPADLSDIPDDPPLEPARPIDPSVPTNDRILPDTATNTFNYAATGGVLIVAGFILYKLKRRKRPSFRDS